MTYIVSSGALNSTHSLTLCSCIHNALRGCKIKFVQKRCCQQKHDFQLQMQHPHINQHFVSPKPDFWLRPGWPSVYGSACDVASNGNVSMCRIGLVVAVIIGVLLGVVIGAVPLGLAYLCLKRYPRHLA